MGLRLNAVIDPVRFERHAGPAGRMVLSRLSAASL